MAQTPFTGPPFDTAVTDRLLSTTRAVRKRLDLERPVEREVILDCLRLAVQAPTGGNGQGWRWIVVTDADRRAQLSEMYSSIARPYLGAGRDNAPDEQTKRVYDSAVYLADILDQVPVHVIPCIEGRNDGSPNLMAASFYGSILPAVWSFMLALRSRCSDPAGPPLPPRPRAGRGGAARDPRRHDAGRAHPSGLHHGR